MTTTRSSTSSCSTAPARCGLNEAANSVEWHRGLRFTIKDGVVFDTAELLADVRELGARELGGGCAGAVPGAFGRSSAIDRRR